MNLKQRLQPDPWGLRACSRVKDTLEVRECSNLQGPDQEGHDVLSGSQLQCPVGKCPQKEGIAEKTLEQ